MDTINQIDNAIRKYVIGPLSASIIICIAILKIDSLDVIKPMMAKPLNVFLALMVSLLLLVILYARQCYKLVIFPFYNDFDSFLITIGCSNSIISAELLRIKEWDKLYTTLSTLVIIILVFVLRRVWCEDSELINNNKRNEAVDIRNWYLYSEPSDDHKVVIFKEEEVEYDWLGRENIVNLIFDSIRACSNDKTTVLAIKGPWGCGKSTIIKLVEKRIVEEQDKSTVLINDFNPWIYGTEDALLEAMCKKILLAVNVRYDGIRVRRKIRSFIDSICQVKDEWNPISSWIDTVLQVGDDVSEIKNWLQSVLTVQNKRIVFIIDNMDRASKENIILLFKIIGAVFDSSNITYVLSYDEERINNILEDERLNRRYIEKIVTQEITVPEVAEETKTGVYDKVVTKLITHYTGLSEDKQDEYSEVKKFIRTNISNMRQFKRMLNSSFTKTFGSQNKLDKSYLLAIEIICFLEPGLYNTIKHNKDAFIKKGGSSSVKQIIYERYEKYREIIDYLFPSFEGGNAKEEVELRQSKPAICFPEYFDLYFSHGTNVNLNYRSLVDDFIDDINEERTNPRAVLVKYANGRIDMEKWLRILFSKSERIHESVRKSFYESLIDVLPTLFSLEQPAGVIYWTMVIAIRVSPYETNFRPFKSFFRNQRNTYNVSFFDAIERSKVYTGSESTRTVNSEIDNEYRKLCETIINSKVNLYGEMYKHNNVCKVLKHYVQLDEKQIIDYFSSVLNSNTVYKILADLLCPSEGNTYIYGVWLQLLEQSTFIDEVVMQTVPENKQELLLAQYWSEYKRKGYGDSHPPIDCSVWEKKDEICETTDAVNYASLGDE